MGELRFYGYDGRSESMVAAAWIPFLTVIAMEEISKLDASCSVAMSVNNSLVCWGLEEYGSEEQKQKYLVPLAKGEKLRCFCTK
jgi:alkylation response protein AidB-like acyl-CoA dehydrogenase